jgi:hypothetical protein
VLGVFPEAALFENSWIETMSSAKVLHLNEYLSINLKPKKAQTDESLLKQLQASLVFPLHHDRQFVLLDSMVKMPSRQKLGTRHVK